MVEEKEYKKEGNVSASLRRFFRPTIIFEYAFAFVVLFVLAIGFFSFPISALLSNPEEFSFEIGYPFVFISPFAEDNELFSFSNFIIDFLIYLLLAYLIDVSISNFYRAMKKSIKKDIKTDEKEIEEERLESEQPKSL